MRAPLQVRITGALYAEWTIRTRVGSRMCADTPGHHGKHYGDVQRGDGPLAPTDRPKPQMEGLRNRPHVSELLASLGLLEDASLRRIRVAEG